MKLLAVATISRSLVLQSPASWEVARERGYELAFAAAPDAWTPELETLGSFVATGNARALRPRALARLARDLAALSRRDEWDLIQIQSPLTAAVWRVVAPRRARRRTLCIAHGLHFQPSGTGVKNAVVRFIETCLARRVRAVATVSKEDFAWLSGLPRPLRPRIVWSLPGAGVDVARFQDGGGRAPVDQPYLLFCGDLNGNKDPLLAVAAAERYRLAQPDCRLVVIGEGPLGAEVERLSRTRPWLRLVPRTRDMHVWLSNAAVLLAPSHHEGVPRVIIEALAAGTPVVARANRGSRELLSGGVGIIMGPRATAQGWAEAIADLLRNPPAVDAMRARAGAYDVAAFRASYAALLDALGEPAGETKRPPRTSGLSSRSRTGPRRRPSAQ